MVYRRQKTDNYTTAVQPDLLEGTGVTKNIKWMAKNMSSESTKEYGIVRNRRIGTGSNNMEDHHCKFQQQAWEMNYTLHGYRYLLLSLLVVVVVMVASLRIYWTEHMHAKD